MGINTRMMLDIREISKALFDAVEGVCSKTYLQDRPSSVSEKVQDYLVVSLPVSFLNSEIGGNGEYGYWTTTARFTIFTKDALRRHPQPLLT